ncbi:helix-turn-helix domain-containing protein [Lachnospiraceae bacterium 46-15]
MDQKKIGGFLRELRKEKGMTQEQLAEVLGVTNRSISRWENGVNMPDFDFVIELANYFDVGIEELLDGERKIDMIEKKQEETLLKVADYSSNERIVFSKRLSYLFLAAIVGFIAFMVMDIYGLTSRGIYEAISDFVLGLIFGMLILGFLYTRGYLEKVRAFKLRILHRDL